MSETNGTLGGKYAAYGRFRLIHYLIMLLGLTELLQGGALADQNAITDVVLNLGHSSWVRAVALSPDGRVALTGSDDKSVKLWDVASGRELRTFVGHGHLVTSVAFSPDGKSALSGSYDKTLKLWDIASGRELRTFVGHGDRVNSVAFSPDGRSAVSGGYEDKIKLWDVASGRELRTLRHAGKYAHDVRAVAFSPDGRTILSGSHDQTLKLWDVSSGRLLRTFSGHLNYVKSVAFSPDGKSALSASTDKTLKLWEVASGRELRTFPGHEDGVWSVAFSPDGRSALSGSYDQTLKLWDIASGRELRTFVAQNFVHSVAFSPDGRTALSGSLDVAQTWDVSNGQERRTFGGTAEYVQSVAFSSDGRIAIAKGKDLEVVNAATGRSLRTFGHSDYVVAAAFSPDGRTVVSASDRTVKLWDLENRRELITFTGHADKIWSVAFSPEGKSALSKDEKTIKLWDVASGRELRTFTGYSDLGPIAFSPINRTFLATGKDNKTIKLIDVETGRELRSFIGHADMIWSVAFSPDGKSALSGSSDKTLKLWDIASGRILRTFPGHEDGVWSVAFSPDGRSALSGSFDKTLKLWDVASGRELRTLAGHSDRVRSVAFSPDGRTILSSSSDQTVRFWSAQAGQELARRITSKDGASITMTPVGFFDRTGEGETALHLVRGMEVISIEQAFEHLFRPDLLEAALGGDPEGKHKDSAHALNLTNVLESGPAPQIEHIIGKDERVEGSARISVRVTGTGGGVGSRVVWRVNGVTQGTTSPPELASTSSALASVVLSETLKLVPGQANVVEVNAYNRAGLVASRPLKITIDKFGVTTEARPRLFVLALGVDKYRMREYQLSYAAHDARSFAKAMEAVGGGLFTDVHSKSLTDDDVSEARISEAIAEIGRAARPDDVFVLFLGGHGKSIAGRYFYYPQTLDFSKGHTVEQHGIGQDKWESWLAKVSVQKSLLIIDTCEGDAFRGARGTDSARQTAMAQLQHATGRNIIAASRDAAYEGYQGHGVLTYALLEALDKKTSNGDDRVRVAALADHVGVRVPEISQKSFGIYQTPTRKLTGNDFPIGIRQAVLSTETTGPEIPKEPTHVLIRAELLREEPAPDAPASRTLSPGTQVRAVEFVGSWVVIAREGQKLGYIPVDALVRMQ